MTATTARKADLSVVPAPTHEVSADAATNRRRAAAAKAAATKAAKAEAAKAASLAAGDDGLDGKTARSRKAPAARKAAATKAPAKAPAKAAKAPAKATKAKAPARPKALTPLRADDASKAKGVKVYAGPAAYVDSAGLILPMNGTAYPEVIEGELRCLGACGELKKATAFQIHGKKGLGRGRYLECGHCQRARLAANVAAKAAGKAQTPRPRATITAPAA